MTAIGPLDAPHLPGARATIKVINRVMGGKAIDAGPGAHVYPPASFRGIVPAV